MATKKIFKNISGATLTVPMKQISEVEEKLFTSSLNIYAQKSATKGAGGTRSNAHTDSAPLDFPN
jgi:hypothetical protein